MTFFDFLDRQYRNLNLDLQVSYSLSKEGEMQASQKLIGGQRMFYRWVSYVKLILAFFVTKAGWKEVGPDPVERFKKYQDELTAQKVLKAQIDSKMRVVPAGDGPQGA